MYGNVTAAAALDRHRAIALDRHNEISRLRSERASARPAGRVVPAERWSPLHPLRGLRLVRPAATH